MQIIENIGIEGSVRLQLRQSIGALSLEVTYGLKHNKINQLKHLKALGWVTPGTRTKADALCQLLLWAAYLNLWTAINDRAVDAAMKSRYHHVYFQYVLDLHEEAVRAAEVFVA